MGMNPKKNTNQFLFRIEKGTTRKKIPSENISMYQDKKEKEQDNHKKNNHCLLEGSKTLPRRF
jgi:hypothetical protein